MGSRGKLLFDLNEAPMDDCEEIDVNTSLQPQKALPVLTSDNHNLLLTTVSSSNIVINNTFSHNSSVSGFQPFVRSKVSPSLETCGDQKNIIERNSNTPSLPNLSIDDEKTIPSLIDSGATNVAVEREEGECCDSELSERNSAYEMPTFGSSKDLQGFAGGREQSSYSASIALSSENEPPHTSELQDKHGYDQRGGGSYSLDGDADGSKSIVEQKDQDLIPKRKEIKGIEASYAQKCANSLGKKHKLDEHKEAMLGKKRNRQTMFLNLEDVKQAGAVRSSTPKRQNVSTPNIRNVKGNLTNPPPAERNGEKQSDQKPKDQNLVGLSCKEDRNSAEPNDRKAEAINNSNAGLTRRLSTLNDASVGSNSPPITSQGFGKQSSDPQQLKNLPVSLRKPASGSHGSIDQKSGNGKKNPPKKQTGVVSQFQDTSVERLLREVTSDKLWRTTEDNELQCVPREFDSVEQYIRVLEPLLFEECRAQLYSTWVELTEAGSRDVHTMVRIKSVERRERGWFDVIVLPLNETKWQFKEGDVAVLSSSKPGSVRLRRNNRSSIEDEEPDAISRAVGTVRRHIPVDTRDPMGAILHFYIGDSYDSNSADNNHILRKLKPRDIWFLTILGSLATTQREYVALHAFRRLNSQMQNAILQPSPEHFPKYQEQTPAIPECLTPKFVEHLHKAFNGPQLAAIQWAATHTAAGTSNGVSKKQDPWPFTLVQGPPGTGKTHTVRGMLNVIHLVQYQHYYAALLKKLAPESYKLANDSNNDNVASGSIDEVLQSMDQNLFRTLPKLCPKPRMLVCAPSNAATDELLSRVLDHGFMDGEMKVYRPDVARVGVDSHTPAAQAVSVERRTEQLLFNSREKVYEFLQYLKVRENQLSHEMSLLQRQLTAAAYAGRSEGSVGVDPDILLARDQNRDALLQSLAAVVEARDKILVDMSRFLIVEAKFRPGSGFNLEEARASLEASFANEAEIVFTTLSSSGRKIFSRLTHGFDMVVIDEAAQASEVGILPPLSLGAARCVLVGDPQQLPATVISKAAGTLLYSRSLFERFQQAGCPTMLLSVQHRMHPHIRDFPSRYFYQGRLTDSESVSSAPDEKYYQDPLLKPYLFYDITHGRESHRGGSVSYQNVHEAQFCLRLYEHLQKTVKTMGLSKVTVGIITPYKLQLKCIQREFDEVLKSEEGRDLYVNTVDAFQGQERDVIIMSCVRASGHGVGFVADIRRMNVALTRARRALWIMGNANALIQSDDWAELVADAKARKCYLDMDSLPKDFQMVKGPPSYNPFPSKFSHGARGLRSSGLRPRFSDMSAEFKPGASAEEEDRSNHRSMNGVDNFGDRPRDARQYGMQKRHNPSGAPQKRDS